MINHEKQLNKIKKHNKNKHISIAGKLDLVEKSFDSSKPIVVSIICNCFNHANYIKEAIESFESQLVNFNVEILIHDDASTDGSKQIINELWHKYPNTIFPFFQLENQYSKDIRILETFQLPRARGKYIAFCEGDDFWCNPYKLVTQVEFMEKNEWCSLCVHDTYLFDDLNRKYGKMINCNKNMVVSLNDSLKRQARTSSFMFKKNYILEYNELSKYVPSLFGDYDIYIYSCLKNKTYYFSNVFSVYRRYSSSSSSTSKAKKDNNRYTLILKERNLFLKSILKYCESKKQVKRINYEIAKNENNILIYSKNYLRVFKPKYFRYFFHNLSIICFNIIKGILK